MAGRFRFDLAAAISIGPGGASLDQGCDMTLSALGRAVRKGAGGMEAPRTPGRLVAHQHEAALVPSVLLATCEDGVALERRSPQLVVPHDQCGSRYISTVTHIWIGAHHAVAAARCAT